MPRRLPARKPLRDQVAGYAKILRALIPEGKPMPAPVASLSYLDKPKRPYAKRQVSEDSERSVLKQIIAALNAHPLVVFVWREQSGVFGEGNRVVTVGFRGKPDLIGMLRTGHFFAIEVKNSAGGKESPEQAYYLSLIRAGGGLAGFASSVDDAISIIEG